MGASRILDAARRRDHELVGCEHQLTQGLHSGLHVSSAEEAIAAMQLCRKCLTRLHRRYGLPWLGGGDERRVAARSELDSEIPGAPEHAIRLVTAACL